MEKAMKRCMPVFVLPTSAYYPGIYRAVSYGDLVVLL